MSPIEAPWRAPSAERRAQPRGSSLCGHYPDECDLPPHRDVDPTNQNHEGLTIASIASTAP